MNVTTSAYRVIIPEFNAKATSSSQEWRHFCTKVKSVFRTPGYAKVTAKEQVNLVRNWLGHDCDEEIDQLWTDEQKDTLDTLDTFLKEYGQRYSHSKDCDELLARIAFDKIYKEKTETCDQFLKRLKLKANDCAFEGDEKTSRLRDMFLQHISDEETEDDAERTY